MSEVLTQIIFDAATGETTVVPFTPKEIAELEARASEEASVKAQAEAKLAAREAALVKLSALGLTEAEIAAL